MKVFFNSRTVFLLNSCWIFTDIVVAGRLLEKDVCGKCTREIFRWVLNLLGQTCFFSLSGHNWPNSVNDGSLEPPFQTLPAQHWDFRYFIKISCFRQKCRFVMHYKTCYKINNWRDIKNPNVGSKDIKKAIQMIYNCYRKSQHRKNFC